MFTKIRRFLCILACACVGLAGFSGCTTPLKSDPAKETAVKIFTQYAVAKYLEDSGSDFARAKRADNIRAVGGDLLQVASGDEVTLPFLKMKAATEIAKLTESPADRLLAMNLLDVIVAELSARIGDGLLQPDQLVTVRSVIQWAVDAAALISPPTQ